MSKQQTASRKKSAPRFQAVKLTDEQRQHMIAEAAYYIAAQRGFEGGDPVQDWLQAETNIINSIIQKH